MLPYIQIGPATVQLPGLVVLVGLWLALELTARFAERVRVSGDLAVNAVLWGLGVGVVAARLGYALRYLDAFLQSPGSLFSLNPQTLDPTLGAIGGLLAAWEYARRKKLPLRALLDALSPGVLLFAFFLAIAQLLGGSAYGMPTKLPWGIELWGARRHPTQIYAAVLTLAALGWILRAGKAARGDGTLFLQTVGLLAAIRLFVEGFRGDSVVIAGGVRVAQLVALVVLLVVWWLYPRWSGGNGGSR